ncbi:MULTISPECIES: hypothetical protein [Halomonas]|uniref:Ribbon-helix-helix protein CopG domain-containing protein n=1 Tax=Halomonas halophila TaxID=29573 RepID=A0ABQ0U716_9GAMM|nr:MULTISPECIES: hypothetical protein [Halomonas]MDR5891127.1 hypothetical protein [Halomonas salina]PSJ22153.1 hypothetical protein CVH10_08770 [Halomonas sp. ND22Bw]WJY08409.1 hypothetical protein QWG60_05710 [Halomonas halophila]GEK74210.1 hypothetical protein HHA04nite_27540 [Halomonas halophila]
MYQDPKRVRTRYGSINLDEYEARLIDALADYTGIERAALLRQLVLKEALETLGLDEFDTPSVAPSAG